MADKRAKKAAYDRLLRELLANPAVTQSTMMGLPCLRLNGAFFAALDRSTNDLVVKVPAGRVAELIAEGTGRVFAPNNRPFREWVAIPELDMVRWRRLLEEALAFVASG